MVENSYKLPSDCTVFQAEIYAIKMAMEGFNNHILNSDEYIKVFSDSRAAIQALNSNIVSSQLVKDTVTQLNIIGNKVNRLEISWIKAHVGHEGNERADQLARDANKLDVSIHDLLPPYSHFRQELANVTYKLWTDEWVSHNTCRLSKNFLPFPSKNKSKEILKLSRSQMRRLIELITGQNNLNYVQSKVNQGLTTELCRFCEEEEETFAHLLNECPCFNTYRRDLLQNKPVINTLKWKATLLIQFSRIEVIDEALTTHEAYIDV